MIPNSSNEQNMTCHLSQTCKD